MRPMYFMTKTGATIGVRPDLVDRIVAFRDIARVFVGGSQAESFDAPIAEITTILQEASDALKEPSAPHPSFFTFTEAGSRDPATYHVMIQHVERIVHSSLHGSVIVTLGGALPSKVVVSDAAADLFTQWERLMVVGED